MNELSGEGAERKKFQVTINPNVYQPLAAGFYKLLFCEVAEAGGDYGENFILTFEIIEAIGPNKSQVSRYKGARFNDLILIKENGYSPNSKLARFLKSISCSSEIEGGCLIDYIGECVYAYVEKSKHINKISDFLTKEEMNEITGISI